MKQYYVLIFRSETFVATPMIFTTKEKAKKRMQKEYDDTLEDLKKYGQTPYTQYINDAEALIEASVDYEWTIEVCKIEE